MGRPARGSATAETALALPAVVLVLAALLGTGQVILARLVCVDATRAGARAAARAEPDARVRAVVAGLLPPRTPVEIRRSEGMIRVEVVTFVQVPLPVPAIPVRCAAIAVAEVP